MSLIDIDKFKELSEYILQHIPAVVLGLMIGVSIIVGLYQLILLPAQQAQMEAAVAKQNPKDGSAAPPTKANPPQSLRKPVVVFVDGNGTFAGYHGSNETISTANYLVEKARADRTFGFEAKDAIVPQEGRIDPIQIVDMRPDVVVVHRSTFDKISKNPEDRLKELIRQLKNTQALFLIYSRTPNSDGVWAADKAKETGTEGRVYSYQFRPGQPFKDDSNVIYFLRYIDILARASVAKLD